MLIVDVGVDAWKWQLVQPLLPVESGCLQCDRWRLDSERIIMFTAGMK
jgi:hypothetical protein